jgi:hypothetical protein
MTSAGYLYAGLSQVKYEGEPLDFGEGVSLRPTFAHLMSPNIMAFKRAEKGQPHPGPWRPAHGGTGCDIEVELRVPTDRRMPGGLSAQDTAWWIAALLRLARWPYASVPVLSDQSFDDAAYGKVGPTLTPFEIEPRMMRAHTDAPPLAGDDFEWVRETWPRGANLLKANPKFADAVRVFDGATLHGRTSAALLAVWGALEQLFCPSAGELRYRVSSNIAAYLEEPGPKRLERFKEVMSLYNSRSAAAHRAIDPGQRPLLGSYVLMRNALVKMIGLNEVPTQEDFERLIFCPGGGDR